MLSHRWNRAMRFQSRTILLGPHLLPLSSQPRPSLLGPQCEPALEPAPDLMAPPKHGDLMLHRLDTFTRRLQYLAGQYFSFLLPLNRKSSDTLYIALRMVPRRWVIRQTPIRWLIAGVGSSCFPALLFVLHSSFLGSKSPLNGSCVSLCQRL